PRGRRLVRGDRAARRPPPAHPAGRARCAGLPAAGQRRRARRADRRPALPAAGRDARGRVEPRRLQRVRHGRGRGGGARRRPPRRAARRGGGPVGPARARRRCGMSIRRSSLLAAFAVASLLLAVACGDDGGDASGGGAEGADDQRTVVLLTYDSFALPEEAAERFEELTGARIEVRATGDAGSMLTGALLAAGAPEGDVIFGIDNTLATRVLQEDLLEPFTPDGIDAIPQRYLLEGELGRLLTPVDAGDVCVNVDEAWFRDEGIEPPSTMEDLASEPYRDLLVVESPVTSSPGLAFLLTTIDRYGEDGWQDYWKRLADNGVRVRPSWDDAYYNDYT